MIGVNWSTPAKDVAPAMMGAAARSVTVTFAVPALGATSVQVSERTPSAVDLLLAGQHLRAEGHRGHGDVRGRRDADREEAVGACRDGERERGGT